MKVSKEIGSGTYVKDNSNKDHYKSPILENFFDSK